MDMRGAFEDTLTLARNRGFEGVVLSGFEIDGTTFAHLLDMSRRIAPEFSEGKLGRWLGWAQCVVVMNGFASLDEMKQINSARS